MSDFEIVANWLRQDGRNEADSTFAKLLIRVGGRDVSEFVDLRGTRSKHLEIPAYYLAEWIAENWWPLLWEPRKNEEQSDDAAFLARHSLLSAQHGFALPKVLIVPHGKTLHISALPRKVPLADVRFVNQGQATGSRADVEATLRTFVQAVVDRLGESRLADTWLQDTWSLILDTNEEQAPFCRYAGALGLSPYDIDEPTSLLIERLLPVLGDRLLMDLCLACPPDNFAMTAKIAETAVALTRDVRTSTLSPLKSISLPGENFALPGYRRGLQAATILRQRLGISETDIRGAARVFELLKIDTGHQTLETLARRNDRADDNAVTGAVVRDEDDIKVALLQSAETKRRFTAARAIFSAWSSETPIESRLLTSAVTRDQQANRAFAAELTAPKAIIRSKVRNGRLSQSAVFDLAGDLQIGADVVAKQALNNGIQVPPL